MKDRPYDWKNFVQAALYVLGFGMLAVFGLTFDGGRSSSWLLSVGILMMFLGQNSAIVMLRHRIAALEKTTGAPAGHRDHSEGENTR